uniref:E3 ubiquitin-protein ligase RBBP6 n=1 Tax=Romanomermis culicivorax TaxID=13658 RepID=A0A915J217_ROMCU
AVDYKTLTFDGLHISVGDLKRLIYDNEKINNASADFDLQICNASSNPKVPYEDDSSLIPRNSSVIVARVPAAKQQRLPKYFSDQKDKSTEGVVQRGRQLDVYGRPINATGALGIDRDEWAKRNDLSEVEKLRAMERQATDAYDPSNYARRRVQTGQAPVNYVCSRCTQPGHWMSQCPLLNVRRTTGIPRDELMETTPDDPQAMVTAKGTYVVPILHKVAKIIGKKERVPFLDEDEDRRSSTPEIGPSSGVAVPNELLCKLCGDLLKDAVLVRCCCMSFCDECVRSRLLESDQHQCPYCHKLNVDPDSSLLPNAQLRQAVNSFRNESGYAHVARRLAAASEPQPIVAHTFATLPPHIKTSAAPESKQSQSPASSHTSSFPQILPTVDLTTNLPKQTATPIPIPPYPFSSNVVQSHSIVLPSVAAVANPDTYAPPAPVELSVPVVPYQTHQPPPPGVVAASAPPTANVLQYAAQPTPQVTHPAHRPLTEEEFYLEKRREKIKPKDEWEEFLERKDRKKKRRPSSSPSSRSESTSDSSWIVIKPTNLENIDENSSSEWEKNWHVKAVVYLTIYGIPLIEIRSRSKSRSRRRHRESKKNASSSKNRRRSRTSTSPGRHGHRGDYSRSPPPSSRRHFRSPTPPPSAGYHRTTGSSRRPPPTASAYYPPSSSRTSRYLHHHHHYEGGQDFSSAAAYAEAMAPAFPTSEWPPDATAAAFHPAPMIHTTTVHHHHTTLAPPSTLFPPGVDDLKFDPSVSVPPPHKRSSRSPRLGKTSSRTTKRRRRKSSSPEKDKWARKDEKRSKSRKEKKREPSEEKEKVAEEKSGGETRKTGKGEKREKSSRKEKIDENENEETPALDLEIVEKKIEEMPVENLVREEVNTDSVTESATENDKIKSPPLKTALHRRRVVESSTPLVADEDDDVGGVKIVVDDFEKRRSRRIAIELKKKSPPTTTLDVSGGDQQIVVETSKKSRKIARDDDGDNFFPPTADIIFKPLEINIKNEKITTPITSEVEEKKFAGAVKITGGDENLIELKDTVAADDESDGEDKRRKKKEKKKKKKHHKKHKKSEIEGAKNDVSSMIVESGDQESSSKKDKKHKHSHKHHKSSKKLKRKRSESLSIEDKKDLREIIDEKSKKR